MVNNKALTLSEIDQRIEDLNQIKKAIKSALDTETSKPEEEVMKKYIEIQSVVGVAEYFNALGHRIKTDGHRKGERKYISNDVRDIILNGSKESPIHVLARALIKHNKGAINFNSLLVTCKKL